MNRGYRREGTLQTTDRSKTETWKETRDSSILLSRPKTPRYAGNMLEHLLSTPHPSPSSAYLFSPVVVDTALPILVSSL